MKGLTCFLSGLLVTTLLVAPALTASAFGAPVHVTVSCEGGPGQARVLAEPLDDEVELAPVSISAPLGEARSLDLESGIPWRITVEAEGCWAAPIEWHDDEWHPKGRIDLEMQPAGRVAFSIESEDREPPLVSATWLDAGEDGSVLARQDCRVTKDRGECNLPAGFWDLRLHVEESSPLFFWQVDIEAGATHDLGVLGTTPGSTVTGWVAIAGASSPRASITAEPVRLAGPRTRTEKERRKLGQLEGSTDARGRFALEGLLPGRYRIVAEQEGFSAAETEVEVPEVGLAVEIDDVLTLVARSELTLTLEPPLDPWGQPWFVEIFRETEERQVLESVAKGAAADRGSWTSPAIDAGVHVVHVRDSRGGTWKRQPLDLQGGPEDVFWPVDIVPIRGSVRLGDEPLEATVLFGRGTDAVALESDEDGRFEGSLPREGVWATRIETAEGVRQAHDPVDVRIRSGKSFAEVELDLPATLLRGRVTAGGEPARALVVATRGGVETPRPAEARGRAAELTLWSGADGLFETRGLSPGTIEIRASTAEAESEWQTVHLEEDRSIEVHLEIAGRRIVRGQIVSARSAATIGTKILVLTPNDLPMTVVSDVEGRFSFRVLRDTRSARLIVVPASGGMVFRSVELPAEPDAEEPAALIALPGGAGRLSLAMRDLSDGTTTVRSLADLVPEGELIHDGVGVSVRQLIALLPPAGDLFNDGLPLPPVAPGVWTFCPVPRSDASRCQSLQVTDGSRLTLPAKTGTESASASLPKGE